MTSNYADATARYPAAYASLPLPATRAVAGTASIRVVSSCIALHCCVSLLANLLSQWLQSAGEFKFPYPYIALTFQLSGAYLGLLVWRRIELFLNPRSTLVGAVRMRQRIIIAGLYALTLITSHEALRNMNLATYQLARSSSVVATMLLLCIGRRMRVLPSTLLIVSLPMLGSWLVWSEEAIVTTSGTIYICAVSSTLAVYRHYARASLRAVGGDAGIFLLHILPLSAIIILAMAGFSGELASMGRVYFRGDPMFWLITMVLGLISLLPTVSFLVLLFYSDLLTSSVALAANLSIQPLIVARLLNRPIDARHVVNLVLCAISLALCLRHRSGLKGAN